MTHTPIILHDVGAATKHLYRGCAPHKVQLLSTLQAIRERLITLQREQPNVWPDVTDYIALADEAIAKEDK